MRTLLERNLNNDIVPDVLEKAMQSIQEVAPRREEYFPIAHALQPWFSRKYPFVHTQADTVFAPITPGVTMFAGQAVQVL